MPQSLPSTLPTHIGDELSSAQAAVFLRSMVGGARVGIAMFDLDGRFLLANDTCAGITGVPARLHAGRTISEVAPDLAPVCEPLLHRALAGEHVSSEVASETRSYPGVAGSTWEIEWLPVRDEDGTIMGAGAVARELTDEERTRRTLREAHAQLEAIFDTTEVGFVFLDRDLRIIRVSNSVKKRNGLEGTSAVGLPLSELQPALWPSVRQYYERALAGERIVVEFDRRAHGMTSGPTHLSMSYTPVEQDGQIIGVVAVSVDVSDRFAHQQALTEAYAHLEGVFETVPVGLSVYDRALLAVRVNRRLAEWNGIAREESVGRHVSELFPHFWPRTRPHFERALAGERFTVEVDRHEAGAVTGPAHAAVSYAPVERDGEVVGVIVCSVDVSQRVAHERALASAYAQLKTIFDNVPVAIAVYDRNLRAIRMNEHMARWNKLDAAWVAGRHVSELFPTMWADIETYYRRTLRGERPDAQLDRRRYGIRSGPAHIAASYRPVYVDGEVAGLTVTSSDISDHVRAARRAAGAIAFRDDLISIASHELRTPLTSIIGFSERLARLAGNAPETPLGDAGSDLALIRGESQRMARTLDVLLDLVGLAADAGEMEVEPVALASLVRRQLRMFRERHPGLQLTGEILDEPIVESDGDRITQVITNLLENAARYAGPSAHVVVRVRSNDGTASVEVQDDGPGISFEQQQMIFRRRFRGSTDNREGLGLGLYLSRMIAARLGGTLTVESTPGEGATFTLRLPRVE